MVLDSSAIVAIHLKEPGHERLIAAIEAAPLVVVGSPTVLETSIVLSTRLQRDPRPLLAAFLRRVNAEVIPFNAQHMDAAATAYLRFGRGRHPAALNCGDCLSYAIAAVSGFPLLFTGNDFLRTDVTPA